MKFFQGTKKPKISVIMVDGSFRERFHAVDSFGSQSLTPENYEIIWIEFYSRVTPELKAKIGQYSNARILTLNRDGIYHSSFCFNAGIQASRGDVVFIPDADVIAENTFLEQAYQDHQKNPKLVMYFFCKEEPHADHTGNLSLEHLKKVCRLTNPQNFGGCLSVRKRWLLHINGYEQHPLFGTGFHANGLDVYTRFKNLGLHVRWHPALMLYHPWHPFGKRPTLLHQIQKVLIRYKAVNLITSPFKGIDPAQTRELPENLVRQLNEKKKELQLEGVFESWESLKVDPEKAKSEAFAWQAFASDKKTDE